MFIDHGRTKLRTPLGVPCIPVNNKVVVLVNYRHCTPDGVRDFYSFAGYKRNMKGVPLKW